MQHITIKITTTRSIVFRLNWTVPDDTEDFKYDLDMWCGAFVEWALTLLASLQRLWDCICSSNVKTLTETSANRPTPAKYYQSLNENIKWTGHGNQKMESQTRVPFTLQKNKYYFGFFKNYTKHNGTIWIISMFLFRYITGKNIHYTLYCMYSHRPTLPSSNLSYSITL